jgi:hypothetical protein
MITYAKEQVVYIYPHIHHTHIHHAPLNRTSPLMAAIHFPFFLYILFKFPLSPSI